ncbi:MAG: S-methyl-5'-thioadenosine phosphorylase [Verrucomicrobiota bacterium]
MNDQEPILIGVIGGSGLYEMESLTDLQSIDLETPFGSPSAPIRTGTLACKRVAFLPRHGLHHQISPPELPHHANLWAMKSLGVKWIISVSAVGSLKESIHPREMVVPDQFFDRTKNSAAHTFFKGGIVGHIAFGDPVCSILATALYQAANASGAKTHWKGTYVNMEGPAFSTRAESHFHRQMGFDIIGMTNLAEAKLAREAEISYATLAMVTDYDCWHQSAADVDVESVIAILRENVDLAKRTIAQTISGFDVTQDSPCHHSLDSAIMTPKGEWPAEKVSQLKPLLSRFL